MTSSTATPAGLEARPPESRPERTPAEIEAEIERTRARLAGTVDAIADRVSPANVARRSAESAKSQFVDEQGKPRAARVAVALAVAGAVGFLVWRRSR
jgi:hypothetical protein